MTLKEVKRRSKKPLTKFGEEFKQTRWNQAVKVEAAPRSEGKGCGSNFYHPLALGLGERSLP